MKNIAITAAVSLVVFLVGIGFVRPVQQVVEKVTNTQLGSVVGPDFYFPNENHNGVGLSFGAGSTVFGNASTTCSIKSPAATSTLILGSFNVASTSASATYVGLGKSAFWDATTTTLSTGAALAANVPGTYVSLRTAAGGIVNETFSPNTYFVAKIAGAGPAQIGGKCYATWMVSN